jgi:integrase
MRQLEQRLAAGSAWQDRGFVFTRADGEPLRPDWVGHRFERLAADARLPRLTFHGLRHSHATALIAAGEHVKVVSERLGHYSSAFMLDTYASVLKGMQRDAVERLAAVVGPKIGDG